MLSGCEFRAIKRRWHWRWQLPSEPCSGTVEEANNEIAIWFTNEELYKYEHVNDRVQYDASWFI